MNPPTILHISPEVFLEKSFRLGRRLFESGIKPRHTISIWRGGTPVGLGVDAFYRSRGIFLNHTTIATESYEGIGRQGEVVVKGLEHLINVVCREDDLLIIDDVYESGNTIRAIIETIRRRAKANTPRNITIGTIHSKPEKHKYTEFPVIALETLPGSVWIDYPHELADLVSVEDPDDTLIRGKDQRTWDILHGRGGPQGGQLPTPPHLYLTASQLHYDAVELGLHMARDKGYIPDFLIALWPGGVSAGLPIHEVYKYLAKKGEIPKTPDHISLNTTRTHLTYRSNIIGLDYLVEKIEKHHKILLIEVAFRSGRLISDVISRLKEKLRRNLTLDNISIATLYYNPSDDSTWTVRPFKEAPDYFWRLTNDPLVYPTNIFRLPQPVHDLETLNPTLYEILYKR